MKNRSNNIDSISNINSNINNKYKLIEPLVLYVISLLFLLLLLSSCSSSPSTQHINLIDKNITHIQSEVKAVRNNINKTKQFINRLKEEQPTCNVKDIDDRIEIIDIQMNSIDNNLFNTKEQLNISKNIIKIEIKEYRSKYHKCIIYIIVLSIILTLVIFNRIKINIGSILGYLKSVFNFLGNK